MRLCCFEISHSGISCPDDEGEDYPGVEAALDVARRLAAKLALELPELQELTITILDESGDTVGSMLISPPKPVLQYAASTGAVLDCMGAARRLRSRIERFRGSLPPASPISRHWYG
jgi:hypothetical protein